jgi:hypothetical protein
LAIVLAGFDDVDVVLLDGLLEPQAETATAVAASSAPRAPGSLRRFTVGMA